MTSHLYNKQAARFQQYYHKLLALVSFVTSILQLSLLLQCTVYTKIVVPYNLFKGGGGKVFNGGANILDTHRWSL